MSFKQMNDKIKLKALPSFLEIACCLTGNDIAVQIRKALGRRKKKVRFCKLITYMSSGEHEVFVLNLQ